MKMIRIAKIPYIQEDTDRWGRPEGTFSVIDTQGEIDEITWVKIQEFEGYHLSDEAKKEEEALKVELEARTKLGTLSSFADNEITNFVPHMVKVIRYCGSQIWQFNLRTKTISEEESEYIRSYAIFGEVTLHEWTSEHDEKVKFLNEQVKQMNGIKSENK